MRVVVQRVSESNVKVNGEQIGSIGRGLMLLVGIHEDDTVEEIEWMSNKILNLRIFEDEDQKMNRSVEDVEGALLVVPQFTLYGDAEQGHRPSFMEAAGPEKAEKLYDKMVDHLQGYSTLDVHSGEFGAQMEVSLVNDGPVTILLERNR